MSSRSAPEKRISRLCRMWSEQANCPILPAGSFKCGFFGIFKVRLQGIPPVSFRIFSQSCTKACLCSKRAGPNSHVALKTRHAQTGGPKNPVFERRDFYPLLTISFAKYNYYSKIFTLQEVFLSGSRIHQALISIVNRETHQTDQISLSEH